MPDIALLHGRMMVIAWDAELDGGEEKNLRFAHSVLLYANCNLKELTTNLLIQWPTLWSNFSKILSQLSLWTRMAIR